MTESNAAGLHPRCQEINALLEAAGMPGRVRILAESAPTAQAAADQIGCEVGAIANSLIFTTDDNTPLLIMTSGAHRVDAARVSAAIGIGFRRASVEFVREHTGQPIGGVAPLGHPAPIRTIIDRDLADFDRLWAAGGIPHAVFPLSYVELVRLTHGTELDVA